MEGQSRKNLSPWLAYLFLAHHAGSWWSLSALSIPCPLVQALLWDSEQSQNGGECPPPPQSRKLRGYGKARKRGEGENEDISTSALLPLRARLPVHCRMLKQHP